jgi:hypothetical protein
MFYDEGSKRFMTTEPVKLDRNPIVVSQPVSNGVDSVMSDAGTPESDPENILYTPSRSSVCSES